MAIVQLISQNLLVLLTVIAVKLDQRRSNLCDRTDTNLWPRFDFYLRFYAHIWGKKLSGWILEIETILFY